MKNDQPPTQDRAVQPDQPGAVPRPGKPVGRRGAAGKPDEDVAGGNSAQVVRLPSCSHQNKLLGSWLQI